MSVQWAQTIFGGGGRADLKGLNKVVAKGLESSPLCTFCSFMSPAPAQVREGLVHGVLVWVYKRQMCFNTHHCSSVLLYAHKLLHAHRPLTFLWSLWVSLIIFFFFYFGCYRNISGVQFWIGIEQSIYFTCIYETNSANLAIYPIVIIPGFQSSSKKSLEHHEKYLHLITMWCCFLLKQYFFTIPHTLLFVLKMSSPGVNSGELCCSGLRETVRTLSGKWRMSTSALRCKGCMCGVIREYLGHTAG